MAFTRQASSRARGEEQQGVTDAIVIAEMRASAAAQITALAGCWALDADRFGGDLRRALEHRHAELVTAQQILSTLHQLSQRLAMQCHGNRAYLRLVHELDRARQVAASASLGLLRSVFAAAMAGTPPKYVATTVAPAAPSPMLALIRSGAEPARRTA